MLHAVSRCQKGHLDPLAKELAEREGHMYTIHVSVSRLGTFTGIAGETPEDATLAVESGASLALLRLFDRLLVKQVVVSDDLQESSEHRVDLVFRCPDACTTTILPDLLEPAEHLVEERIRLALFQIFGTLSAVKATISHTLPLDEWDNALKDIA
jgi:hypothetical protein